MTRKSVMHSYRTIIRYLLSGEGRLRTGPGAVESRRWARRTAKRLGIRL
jgi:hypothetical protein